MMHIEDPHALDINLRIWSMGRTSGWKLEALSHKRTNLQQCRCKKKKKKKNLACKPCKEESAFSPIQRKPWMSKGSQMVLAEPSVKQQA